VRWAFRRPSPGDGSTPGAVAGDGPLLHQGPQVAHLGVVLRAGEGWELGSHQRQVEGGRPPDLGRPLHRAGVAAEAAGHLRPRAQVGATGGRQPGVELVQAAPGPHRGQRGGEGPVGRGGVVGVAAGDAGDVVAGGQLGQGVVAGRVRGGPRGPTARRRPGPGRRPPPGRRSSRPAAAGPCSRRAAGTVPLRQAVSTHQCPAPDLGQLGEGGPGGALLPGQLGQADGAGQAGVAVRPVGQDDQVVAHRVGHAVLGRVDPEGELGAEHRGQVDGAGGLGVADHAVQPVVVREGEGLQAQPGRLLGQLLGMGGTVQEAEVGMAVELGVGHGTPPPFGRRRGARRAGACGSRPDRHPRRSSWGTRGRGRWTAAAPAPSTAWQGC
jgi:hypothetical protein